MSHAKMIDAFSVVIQNSLSLYEEQTPLYHYLTIYGSWVLTALGTLSLASVFFTIRQKSRTALSFRLCACGWAMRASTFRARTLPSSTATIWQSLPIRQTKTPPRSCTV